MNYWLIKSEPSVWSFSDQKKAGSKGTTWDGVRNYQAANYLKKMKLEDYCFFYHSNEDKKIRLSVMPIDSKSWKIICKMGRI